MPKSHRPYAPEFRRQMIELVRSGRTPEDLSREFEPTAQAIWNWVRQADRDEGRKPDGAASAEREELIRLRREDRVLPRSATSWRRRQPGSLGLELQRRSRRSFRRGLPIHESEPGCQSALNIDPLSASKIAPPWFVTTLHSCR